MGLFKFDPCSGIVINESLSVKRLVNITTYEKQTEIKDLFLWNLRLDLAGKREEFIDTNPNGLEYETIKKRNWNPDFHLLANQYVTFRDQASKDWFEKMDFFILQFFKMCKNRMILGFYRYGELGNQGMLLRTEYLMKKGLYYQETGNKESLLDSANVAMTTYTERGFKDFGIMPYNPYPNVSAGEIIERAAYYYHLTDDPSNLAIIRNTALLEWIFEKHPKAHFSSLQDEDHGERKKE